MPSLLRTPAGAAVMAPTLLLPLVHLGLSGGFVFTAEVRSAGASPLGRSLAACMARRGLMLKVGGCQTEGCVQGRAGPRSPLAFGERLNALKALRRSAFLAILSELVDLATLCPHPQCAGAVDLR